MSDGLELSTGSKLKRILEVLTKNKFIGVLVGIVVTTIVQSSTATVIMIVGFVRAGLMNLTQSVGVIIGANVGTTTTGLIIALNLHTIAPICIFIGALCILFSKKKKIKHIGMIVAGFGILFLGMRIMSDAMRPLSDESWVMDLFNFAENPFIGILIGFIITALIQSSTAAMGILLAAAMAGMITDINQAIFILYGQNLGTCMTVIISSIGSNKITRKAALIHLIYKTIGIILVVIVTLLPFGFVDFVRSLSSTISTQLVYAHIIINVAMAIVLLPFTKQIVQITEFLIKGEDEEKTEGLFKYIDERLLDNPSLATVQAYKEVERHVGIVFENYKLVKDVIVGGDALVDLPTEQGCQGRQSLQEKILIVEENERMINALSGKINKFLTKLNATDLEYADAKLVASLFRVVMYVERIGNHAVNIIKAHDELREDEENFSSEAFSELASIIDNVERALAKAIKIFMSGEYNEKKVAEVKHIEERVDRQDEQYKNNNIARINAGKCTPATGIAFSKMLTDLERIADYACSIAFSMKKR